MFIERRIWAYLKRAFSSLSLFAVFFVSLISASVVMAQESTSEELDYEALLKAADLAFEVGEYSRAAAIFSLLYDEFPQDPAITNNYAVSLFQSGQRADAASVIQRFLTQHSEVGELTNNLFTIYDYLAAESYALLDGAPLEVPDLRLTDSVAGLTQPEAEVSAERNDTQNENASVVSALSQAQSEAGSPPEASPTVPEANPGTQSDSPVLVSASDQDAELIEGRLNDYILAWSDGDVEQYLGFYYPNESPSAGVTYEDWHQSRIERVYPEREIELIVNDLRVHFESSEDAIMEYLQRYRSRNYSDLTLKQIRWKKFEGVWYIRNERSLPR